MDDVYSKQIRDADRLTEFEITDSHLALLRRACITWRGPEFGAPAIDPQRPYGTSSVVHSVAEIVEPGFKDEWDESLQDAYLDNEHDGLTRLHVETGVALQIILQFGEFTTGRYHRPNTWSDWEKVTS